MTSFEPEPVPVAHTRPDPGLVELAPVGQSPLLEAEEREQRRWNRTRMIGMVCTIITVISSLFAVVLAVHIVMVLGEANPANGVATFVRGWASGVSLGLTGLFTPTSAKAQVLFNSGLAAIAWLAIGAVLTMLIRRFGLPGPRRPVRFVALARHRTTDPTLPQ